MADYTPKYNTAAENHGKKKALAAAVSVIAVIAVLIIAFLASKSSLYYFAAENKAEKNEFSEAMQLIESSNGEKADALKAYLALRLEINASYPAMLTDFDIEKIKSWSEKADELCLNSALLGDEFAADAQSLSQALSQIISCAEEYDGTKSDILKLMDVFNEINRLHEKNEEGKNTSFTIAEERAKISEWEQLNSSVSSFASRIPGGENVYLINYLVKEAQGEISELSKAIDSVAASGYTETDVVRFSGDAEKRFPDITNSSGESVNLLEKEKYEQFMHEEICRQLTENLGSFYAP